MSDYRFHNRSHQTRINTGKNKKHPEKSKPKGFRSLRAFHMSVLHQTVSREGYLHQKVSGKWLTSIIDIQHHFFFDA